jgi:hypothetical protein
MWLKRHHCCLQMQTLRSLRQMGEQGSMSLMHTIKIAYR